MASRVPDDKTPHSYGWKNIQHGLGTQNLYTFEVKRFGDRIFAGQWDGIYVSDDAGDEWHIIRNGLPESTAFTVLEVTKTGLIAGAVISRQRGRE